jgi:cellobiose phosphorylase
LQIAVGSYPGSNIRYLVHFRTDSTPKISRTHELKTRICRLETITNFLIKTLANLETEVEGRFSHYTNRSDTNVYDTYLRDLITVFGNIKLPKIATFFNSDDAV